MIQVKYDICSEVFYFNSVEQRVEPATVTGVRVVPTSVIKDENGKDVVESVKVLYQLDCGIHEPEEAVFASKEECVSYYASLFASL